MVDTVERKVLKIESLHLSCWQSNFLFTYFFIAVTRLENVCQLTLSWRMPLSYRNQSIDLQSKLNIKRVKYEARQEAGFPIVTYTTSISSKDFWFSLIASKSWLSVWNEGSAACFSKKHEKGFCQIDVSI